VEFSDFYVVSSPKKPDTPRKKAKRNCDYTACHIKQRQVTGEIVQPGRQKARHFVVYEDWDDYDCMWRTTRRYVCDWHLMMLEGWSRPGRFRINKKECAAE
jgi:hypothetical protein